MPLPRRDFLACSAAFLAAPVRAETAPIIAAAASLRFAMGDLVAAFPDRIRVTFGSSGTLAQQIRNGAPFELLLSADEEYVRTLATLGALRDDGVIYAYGRLSLMARQGSALVVDSRLDNLETQLKEGAIKRFAIATPEHAPYGIAAREALIHRGLWEEIQPFLVFGENVAQAAQFAASGNADGGLVAASLATAGPVARQSKSTLLPESWHSPLAQRMALTVRSGKVARAFHDFLRTERARTIFAEHGFAPPGPA